MKAVAEVPELGVEVVKATTWKGSPIIQVLVSTPFLEPTIQWHECSPCQSIQYMTLAHDSESEGGGSREWHRLWLVLYQVAYPGNTSSEKKAAIFEPLAELGPVIQVPPLSIRDSRALVPCIAGSPPPHSLFSSNIHDDLKTSDH